MEALFLAVAQVVEGTQQDVQEPRKLLFREVLGGAGGTAALFGGDLEQLGGEAGGVGVGSEVCDLSDDAVAQKADELARDGLRAIAGVEQNAQCAQNGGGVVRVDGGKDLFKDDVRNRAHELADFGEFYVRAAVGGLRGGGDGLVHDGQGVAHGAVARLGQESQRGVVDVDGFIEGDFAQLADDVVELDGVKAEVLTARADSLRDVLGLRGGHHEDDVRGRLFEGFEQGIEGGIGDLVRFIEQNDFEAVAGGAVAGGVAQLANLVDAAVGGGVDFEHIDGVAGANFETGVANEAGLGGGPFRAADLVPAVERRGQDAGDGGLADAAMAAEDVAVRYAVLRERVQQRTRDVVLPDNIGETERAVLAG